MKSLRIILPKLKFVSTLKIIYNWNIMDPPDFIQFNKCQKLTMVSKI